ncbi:MAG TPA: helix-turn-helix transcriptional regulator [Clostridiaceae bacterium]|nr:helix-turn-helix transcriptional regulator [Clostridiaceae bacterium]
MDYSIVTSALDKVGNEKVSLYYSSIPMDDRIVVILNFDDCDYEAVKALLSEVIEHINVENKCNLHISLGRPGDFEKIRKSYFEAYICELFEEFDKQDKNVYCFSDIMKPADSTSTGSCLGLIKDFEINVLRSNIEYLAKFPSLITHEMSINSLPEYCINYIVYEMVRVVIRSLPDDSNQASLVEKIWDFIFTKSPIFSSSVLEEVVTFICNTVIQYIRKNPTTDDSLLNEILAYIDENYNKPNFSIQLMADEFNMSPSWLSHYFKSNMHITIMDYVQNKKIKYAQQLIISNERSTNEISEQLGYCNVSSFIRAFKRIVGLTPKQYKDMYDNKKLIDHELYPKQQEVSCFYKQEMN